MGIKDVINKAPSEKEEALYQQVLEEVESGFMRKGIYAKALADSQGDEGKANALYIKYRVQSLIGEEKQVAGIEFASRRSEEKERKEELKALKRAARKKRNKKRIMFIFWFIFSSLALLIFTQIMFGLSVTI